MDPITGLLSLFSSIGQTLGGAASSLGSSLGLTGGQTAVTLAPSGAGGIGATAGGSLGMTGSVGEGISLAAPSGVASAGNVGVMGAPAASSMTPGLLSKVGDAIMASGAIQAAKNMLPKSTEEMMKQAGDQTGFNQAEKVYTTIKDPNLSMREKFDTIAPLAYQNTLRSQADFEKLQQGLQPIAQPVYAQPYRPYQGGGIQEILARQRGLLS